MRKSRLSTLMASVALAFVLPAVSLAQDNGEYADGVDWDLNRTTSRADSNVTGEMVGGVQSPGYNPNHLRPAGDGLGKHEATQDLNMQSNNISGVGDILGIGNIVGTGTTRILGIAVPIDDGEVANKKYVDDVFSALDGSIDPTDPTGSVTAGDGIEVTTSGGVTEVSIDNTVVRTSGDQNIAGVKNFLTRINVSSTSNRPFDSRSHAANGVGVYGRSTTGGAGQGVLGIADGSNGSGVSGLSLGANGFGGLFQAQGSEGVGILGSSSGASGRGGNFEASGVDGTALFALGEGAGGRAAMLRSGQDADETLSIVGYEEGDNLVVFGVSSSSGNTFDADGAIISTADGIMITGISTPANATDAVNKAYVDDSIAGLADGGPQDLQSVLTEGNNAGGERILSLGAPLNNGDAANKKYVDDAIAGVSGPADTPTLLEVLVEGNLAGGERIRSLGAPVDNNDAVNKKYVDDLMDGIAGAQTLAEVLAVGNTAEGSRIRGVGEPVNNADATTKRYVDDLVAGITVTGGDDNLGNHTATQNLDMSNRRIENIFATQIVQGSGATMTYGNNLPYANVNVAVIGTPGDVGTSHTTYIDDATLDSWRIRTHQGGATNFENALDLRFGERALYLYGDKVLTTANLGDQQLDFNNDRDGTIVTSPGGFVLHNYTTAISSVASGDISASMTFSATGESSTGILGFASGENAYAIRGVSRGPGVIAGNFSAQGDDGTPYSGPQTALNATLRTDVAPGSVVARFSSGAEDTTALEVQVGTSLAKLAAFKVGVHEPLSIVPNGTAARIVGTNGALGSQTVDLDTFSGGLALTGDSSGGLFVTQPGNTPKVTLTRTNSTGNSHIRYAGNVAGESITVGLGNPGRFAIGTGNDLSYASSGTFEVLVATGDVRWKGTATGTVSTPSDARLKENVSDIVNALDKLSQLRPVEYDLKADGAHNYGVIAQELEAIYPEMVNVDDDGILSVEYQQLITPMLAALLEMDARITALEAR